VAGIVHIPWYATLFRGDRFEKALADIAPVALRYGAVDYEVRRSTEDSYRFVQSSTWENHADFYAYWEGPEFEDFRTRYQSWFQVPILYEWFSRVTRGGLAGRELTVAHPEAEGEIT
jgi:quinol monooxygenase YgiN